MQQSKPYSEMTVQVKMKILEYAKYEKEGIRDQPDHREYWRFQKLVRDLIFYDKWDGIVPQEVKKILQD